VRKLALLALSVVFLLSACAPNFQKQNDTSQQQEKTKGKAIIPKYNISDQYYRTVLPFEPSAARGMTVADLNTRYDINEFETGLQRIAQNTFSTDKYYFQEGQYLKKDTIKSWLNRKYTDQQLKDKGIKPQDNVGLNPVDDGSNPPIYLAHISEQDYLTKDDKGNVSLGGVAIGLALNSTYYYQTVQYGPTNEKAIAYNDLVAQGKSIAQEVLKRLRGMKDLSNVPITIGLFDTQSKTSVVPGNFIMYTSVDKGNSSIDKWNDVKEKYYLFPSDDAQKDHRDDLTNFLNFKQDVESYFPNFNGVIGKAFYSGDQLQNLDITIPIQFYGETEAIGFTQYVAGLVMERFPKYINVSVNVTSVNGPESLIVRKANDTEPFVHIYSN
jgi:protein involved in sex pheromone biosynthesis